MFLRAPWAPPNRRYLLTGPIREDFSHLVPSLRALSRSRNSSRSFRICELITVMTKILRSDLPTTFIFAKTRDSVDGKHIFNAAKTSFAYAAISISPIPSRAEEAKTKVDCCYAGPLNAFNDSH